jgi:hypothetical protein
MSKWAVLVIHGVGATRPGATVDQFMPSVAAARNGTLRPDGVVEVHHLVPDGPPPTALTPVATPPREDTTFPVHVRRAAISVPDAAPAEVPREAVVAEVYWADLSRIREGWFHSLLAMISTVFLIRFVSDQAAVLPATPTGPEADRARKAARWLRALLYAVALLLNGPLTACALLLALVLLFDHVMMPAFVVNWGSRARRHDGFMVAAGLVTAVAGAAAWWWGKQVKSGSTWTRVWGALLPVGLAFALALFELRERPPEVQTETVSKIATWIRLESPQDGAHPGDIPRRLHAPVLLLAGLHASLVAICVLVLVASVPWMIAIAIATPERRPGLGAALGATVLQIALWVLLFYPIARLAISRVSAWVAEPHLQERLTGLLNGMERGFSVFVSLAIVVGVVTWSIWLRRGACARAHQGEYQYPDAGHDIPRLIVNRWILGLLIGLFWWVCASVLDTTFEDRRRWWEVPVLPVTVVTAVAVPLLSAALTCFSSGLRNALHVLTDVINHFYSRRDHFPVPWGDEEPVNLRDFEIQQRIEARFRAVLTEVLSDPAVTRLSIVAHSQGTIIAADVLSRAAMDATYRQWLGRTLRRVRRVRLVTMGSPVTHLYQHYFPSRYAGLAEPQAWRGLRSSLARWVNVYRIDDCVGTFLEQPAGWPIDNVPIHAGGHTAYWDQPAVFRAALDQAPDLLPG